MALRSTDENPALKSPLLLDPSSESDGEERMGVDEMLERYCGEFGPWQLRHFTLVSLAWALDGLHTMITIFADREPAWRCRAASCGGGSSVCGLPPGSWEWVDGPGSSTVTEWGLVCGDKYKTGISRSAFFAGSIVGCGIFGTLSDSFLGRKGSLMVGCIVNSVLGCLTAASPSYGVYVALRALMGLCTGSMGTTVFILATEPVGHSYRAAVGMSVFYFFSAGVVALAALAYTFPSWRALYVASSLPTLAFVLLVLPFVSESPRWYLIRRKTHEAMQVMRAIAAANGRCLPEDATLALDNAHDSSSDDDDDVSVSDASDDDDDVSDSIVDVVRCPLTRVRLALSVAVSLFCSVVYYGLTLNVVNLKTNLYVSVLVNAVCEMPSFTVVTLLLAHVGRRPLAVGTMLLSGAFCMAGGAMSGAWMEVGRMACGVVGIFSIAATYNLLLVYTAELFPTAVRSAALGCVQQAEQVGAVVAPMVVVLGGGAPLMVFGGLLSLRLPETQEDGMYDTMEAMENAEREGKEEGV